MSRKCLAVVIMLLPLIEACNGHYNHGILGGRAVRDRPHHSYRRDGQRRPKISEVRAIDLGSLGKPRLLPLKGDTAITTGDGEYRWIAIVFRRNPILRFDALLGPNSQGYVDEPTASFILNYGWVYCCGYWPRICHDKVSAGADGSAIAMVAFPPTHPDPDKQGLRRFYFFKGDSAWVDVDVPGQDSIPPFRSTQHYVHITASNDASLHRLPWIGEIRDEHDDIQAIGEVGVDCQE